MNVALLSPGGDLVFASNVDTVRSTAVSGVGVIIIVLAFLGLAYWWIRNIRHGRRARKLVTVPDGNEVGKGAVDAEPAPPAPDPDDAFADFFSSPAPRYPLSAPPPVSPSRGSAAPKT